LLTDKEKGQLPPDEVLDEAVPDLPNVQVTSLTLMSEQAPGPITMDLTGNSQDAWCDPEPQEAPRGVLVRGAYVVTSFFTDDDRTPHLSWETGRAERPLPQGCVPTCSPGLWGRGPGPEGALEEPPEEEPPEEDGILVLSRQTLGLALREHPALLVEFCECLGPGGVDRTCLLPAGPDWPQGRRALAGREQGLRLGPWRPGALMALSPRRPVDLQDKDVATFLALAQDALDVSFGLTNQPQLFQKFGLTKDTVVLFKKYDEGRADFPVDEELGLDQGDLSRFLLTHSMHLVTEFNSQTSRKIFAARILNHLLLFYFGLKAEEAPTLRFINTETTKKYMPADRGPVTATSVAAFCHAVLGGEVKPYHLSQEVPPDWDQRPVKTLVGKNFEQVAFDETKNVFIKFYAPWCTHCKEMAPAWEALAEKYRDHEDIVIAELDATANELEALPVHGFPTLKYFPAGPGRKVIEYKGTRDLETFSKFLDSGGELPAEEPTEVPGAPF
ncbi:hypothetical protein E2I00_007293, partial [Balaenoptera physalus]